MRISPDKLQIFIEIYRQKYKQDITDEDAQELALWMMNILANIYDKI